MIVLAILFSMRGFAAPLTTVLKLKERVSMEQLARNVLDPSSDHYQRFYEPAEIRQLAGPSDQEYDDLLAGLKADGFRVVAESPTHLWVSIQGERAMYESVFSTQIQPLGDGAHQALRPARVPVQMKLIDSVSGFDNRRKSSPKLRRAKLTPAFGGVQPATIKTSYGFDAIYAAGINGAGQDIAIATYDGFRIDNVKEYFRVLGIAPAPNIEAVEFNGPPTYQEGSAGETELDAEFAGMIAPGANIHVFASAANSDAGELQMFTAILDDNRAKVVNYSWGSCEGEVSTQHREEMTKVFARALAQGVNIFVASGDSGSDSCGTGAATADWPAASSYVVAVGGTSFAQNKGVLHESAWDGSGGGISAVWDLPTWQNGLGTPFVKRSYPDVAFNADPNTGQACYSGPEGAGVWEVVGGTSIAAPQWAGFMALVGHARQRQGKADIGFLNPILYSLNAGDRAQVFHDVTVGSNGAYSATSGWDAVTGLGSMRADALLNVLQAF